MSLKLGIVAGEPSGDRLGGGLLRALSAQTPVASFGIGGSELGAAGLRSLLSLHELSMHGFTEPLQRLPFLWQTLKRVEEQMLDERVDVFVGVDFNVFNLLLEGRLKRRGIPVVHYVSPSVYAWRRGRTRRVARSADLLLTLFPFEPPLYSEQPIRAVFVGHPLADEIDLPANPAAADSRRKQARAALGIASDATVVTLMPGSRMSEVQQMLNPFLQAAVLVAEQLSTAVFLLPCATPAIEAIVRNQLSSAMYSELPLTVTGADADTQAYKLLAASDAALIKSGTSTLEAMLLGVPMVVAYQLPAFTYQVVRRLLRTEFVALPNILAGEALVPELLQDEMQPPALARALMHELQRANRDKLQTRFAELHRQLANDASQTAAIEVLGLARRRGFLG